LTFGVWTSVKKVKPKVVHVTGKIKRCAATSPKGHEHHEIDHAKNSSGGKVRFSFDCIHLSSIQHRHTRNNISWPITKPTRSFLHPILHAVPPDILAEIKKNLPAAWNAVIGEETMRHLNTHEYNQALIHVPSSVSHSRRFAPLGISNCEHYPLL
jgi:hypothetical protein